LISLIYLSHDGRGATSAKIIFETAQRQFRTVSKVRGNKKRFLVGEVNQTSAKFGEDQINFFPFLCLEPIHQGPEPGTGYQYRKKALTRKLVWRR